LTKGIKFFSSVLKLFKEFDLFIYLCFMSQLIHKIILIFILAGFSSSVLKTTSVASSQLSEEQVEILLKNIENEEDNQFELGLNSFSKQQFKFSTINYYDNKWNGSSYLVKNYIEPTIHILNSPPEFQV
jgi:hypothetical protein